MKGRRLFRDAFAADNVHVLQCAHLVGTRRRDALRSGASARCRVKLRPRRSRSTCQVEIPGRLCCLSLKRCTGCSCLRSCSKPPESPVLAARQHISCGGRLLCALDVVSEAIETKTFRSYFNRDTEHARAVSTYRAPRETASKAVPHQKHNLKLRLVLADVQLRR